MNSPANYLAEIDALLKSSYLFSEEPQNLYAPASHMLQMGGKHVRPLLVYLAHELFETPNIQTQHAALAVELFHNFTLVHDDIMDNAALRRTQPTVPAKFGLNAAILSGDILLIKAYEQLQQIDAAVLADAFQIFNKTATEVCEGQQFDMDFEKLNTVSLPEYIKMISLKTSVLLGAALQLGALIAGASIYSQQKLYDFGMNVGIAFQLQDDYLDAFGDEDINGKLTGGDIIANKKTALWIYAMQNGTDEQKTKLLDLYSSRNSILPHDKIAAVKQIFEKTNAPKYLLNLKQTYFQQALESLEQVPVQKNRKTNLQNLATTLLNRTH